MLKKQKGATLLELIMVLAIILIFMLLILNVYNTRQKDMLVQKMVTNHRTLMETIQAVGASKSSFALTGTNWNNFLQTNDLLPAGVSLGAGTGVLRHAMGGSITITPTEFMGPSTGSTAPGIPLIQSNYDNLSRSACLRFVNQLAPLHHETLVNGNRVRLRPAPFYNETDLTQLNTLCANSDLNIVQFTYMPLIPVSTYGNDSLNPTPEQITIYNKLALLRALRTSWWP